MEKINIAELLKDCPQGMELDCTMYDNVTLSEVDLSRTFPILLLRGNKERIVTTEYGQYQNTEDSKCIIFPKGKTTWDGFVPPCKFKDGDVVFTTLGNIAIIRKPIGGELFCVYGIMVDNGFYKDETIKVVVARLATEEEKQKLFQAIKDNGYKWNAETKTLDKLHKFKAGDEIRGKYTDNIYTISHITLIGYELTDGTSFDFDDECCFELTLNKFDITTLVPLESKVLVRDCDQYEWEGEIFTRYAKSFNSCNFITLGGQSWKQCIPYNGDTKHLLGKTDDCDDFYKTWE